MSISKETALAAMRYYHEGIKPSLGGGASGDIFTGATSIAGGASGLVPAPAVGEQKRFLRGDGAWAVINGAGGSGGVVLDSGSATPAVSTIQGGFWCGEIDSTPALRLRYGDYIYNFNYDEMTLAGDSGSALDTTTAGEEYVLDTTPATVNGGLWYELSAGAPVLKVRKGSYNYSFGHDTITYVGGNSHLVSYLPFDSSPTADACGKTWTVEGGAELSTEMKKFGKSALDTQIQGYLLGMNIIDLNAEKWTIHFWLCPKSGFNGGICTFGYEEAHGTDPYGILVGTGGFGVADTNKQFQINCSFSTSLGTWSHVAIVKDGTTIYTFFDGVLKGSGVLTGEIGTATKRFVFGNNHFSAGNGNTNCYIDELAIYEGQALWTENFTPPTAEDYE